MTMEDKDGQPYVLMTEGQLRRQAAYRIDPLLAKMVRKVESNPRIDGEIYADAGDRLTLIEKGMGLPAGARQVVLAEVEVVDVRPVALFEMTAAECVLEGFPNMTGSEFIAMWRAAHGPLTLPIYCRRIEWRYLDAA